METSIEQEILKDAVISEQAYEDMAHYLEKRLVDWEKAHKAQEQKMLECYQDVMRIPREDDSKGSGISRPNKAGNIFIGSTRNKVRASRAKIIDALFGNGKLPFDTEPSSENLKDFSDVVEDIISWQLDRMDFRSMMRQGVDTLATYGTGFITGPFVKDDCLTITEADNSLGITQIKETEFEFKLPKFELCNTLDCYPDPEARNIDDGEGFFHVTMESKHTVESWGEDESYRGIQDALKGTPLAQANETGSDRARRMRANIDYWMKNDRIKVARFYGLVPEKYFMGDIDEEAESPEEESKELCEAIIIMAGGVVVKANRNPLPRIPVARCVYEDVPHEIWGVGVAENNMPHQKVTNAAFRLFLEGKALALLGTKSVDRSKFLPSEKFIKYPGKVYEFKPGLTPEERQGAIIEHNETDVTAGWFDVIRASEQFSDDDTGITKYTQGDDSSNLNKTATGISMIMSASSLPLKEVIQNIDKNWIERIVEDLIDWNIKFLDVETVRVILGEEKAAIWEQIKQFGKTSFMDWKATGTSSFMQKEVLTSKLNAFSAFALSNPQLSDLIDKRELLEQTWDAMEVGRESPIVKDVDMNNLPPQIQQMIQESQQQMQMMQQQAEMAIQQLSEENAKLQDQLGKEKLDIEKQILAKDSEYALTEKDIQSALDKLEAEKQRVQLESELAVQKIQEERIRLESEFQVREERIQKMAAQHMERIHQAKIPSQESQIILPSM